MVTPKQIIIAIGGLAALGLLMRTPAPISPLRAGNEIPTYNFAGGYLAPGWADGSLQVPPPPTPGSEGLKRDEAAREAALKLRDTPRYVEAVADSKRSSAATLQAFSCAFGMDVTEAATPRLYRLLTRTRIDVRQSASPFRKRYMRQRPYVMYNTQTCSPADEALVEKEGSYPSARSAVGWSYALVLALVNPARSDALLKRGSEFGQSRVICDAQWQSDVDAGRELGTRVVTRLRADKAFEADLAAAKQEVAKASRAGAKPSGQCAGQSALASR